MTEEVAPGNDGAAEWPLRPWLTAGLFGLGGLLIHGLTYGQTHVAWQVAAATFVFFGFVAVAFTFERDRWRGPAWFSVVVGLVMAGLAWRAVQFGDRLADPQYGIAAGVVASALTLPLFQADFGRRRFATPYADVFHHIWSDAISAAGAAAFVGLSWLVLFVLAQLFHLLKIDVLKQVMDQGWFGWTFSGVAAGAALGTIRNQLKVLATLQGLVLMIAALLAVPLAAGLVLFLIATVVSGPQVLWDATRSATPVLLACAAGAFVLTSAILRQDDATMTRSRLMRAAAMTLSIVILPLALFAAVSMGLRLRQYGLAPDRMWGLVAIIVACAWGLGYWVALARGRTARWAAQLRQANLHLALGVCALALVLALPIVDFGRIAAGNQLHRLQSGQVSADKFDFAALRWDFGAAGRQTLARLTQDANPQVARLARAALAQKERTYPGFGHPHRTRADFHLRVLPEDPAVHERLIDYLVAHPFACQDQCVALDVGASAGGGRRIAIVQSGTYELVVARPAEAAVRAPVVAPPETPLSPQSRVVVGTARVIRVDGRVVGLPLDDPANETPDLDGLGARR